MRRHSELDEKRPQLAVLLSTSAARTASRRMSRCAAGRAGTPDEVGSIGALLMGPDGGFITGSDILMDGGVTVAYWYCELAPR